MPQINYCVKHVIQYIAYCKFTLMSLKLVRVYLMPLRNGNCKSTDYATNTFIHA